MCIEDAKKFCKFSNPVNSDRMSKRSIKRILFALVLLILWLPLVQSHIHFPKERALKGAIERVEKPTFHVDAWLQGNFQKKTDSYYNQNFGFRASLVRLNNQLRFWLFGAIKAKGVVTGKDGYLYEYGYIETIKGGDFVGEAAIDKTLKKLEKLRDTLHQRGTDLVVLFAAGKGYYHPEFIADKYQPNVRSLSNFDYYTQQIAKTSIPYIDCNRWFRAMKDTTTYPLFPKTGTHWTKYADLLVADSLSHFISNLRGIETPQIKIYDIEYPEAPRGRDNDIGDGMNLWFDMTNIGLAYPKYKIEKTENSVRPKVLTIADSFYWGIYGEGFQWKLFNGEFWYYNNEIYPPKNGRKYVKDLQKIQSELEGQDVILLISTDTNLERFPYGFLGKAYDAYFNQGAVFEALVQQYVQQIKASEKWVKNLQEKADKQGKNLEAVILEDANYMARQASN